MCVRVRVCCIVHHMSLRHKLLRPLNGLFSITTWVSRYQKGKTSLDLNEARDDGVLGCSGISCTICKQSAPRCRQIINHTNTSSLIFFTRWLNASSWFMPLSPILWTTTQYVLNLLTSNCGLCVWKDVVDQVWASFICKQVSACRQAASCQRVWVQSCCVIKPTSTASHRKIKSQTLCWGFFCYCIFTLIGRWQLCSTLKSITGYTGTGDFILRPSRRVLRCHVRCAKY